MAMDSYSPHPWAPAQDPGLLPLAGRDARGKSQGATDCRKGARLYELCGCQNPTTNSQLVES